jgi:hypothetical protein
MGPERRKARAALAVAKREVKRHPDDPSVIRRAEDRQLDYKVTAAEDYLTRLVSSWPPIGPEQRDRLALLLRGGS